ncbi:hypothetical protein [Actinokineospora diospyrosa]|uniref:Uncharacterized protein n=1 Tax=Actinokineospora diospyrosa TaxID=103728 RepID=A0ABT1I8B9_9PSEU|nr:hypothetical protein [Actinokineospora diospyrosa]MCP2268868.1 hypothetical protein [Actinokineospora diospyrosa]
MAENSIHVGGDATGNFVAGDGNVVGASAVSVDAVSVDAELLDDAPDDAPVVRSELSALDRALSDPFS